MHKPEGSYKVLPLNKKSLRVLGSILNQKELDVKFAIFHGKNKAYIHEIVRKKRESMQRKKKLMLALLPLLIVPKLQPSVWEVLS